MGLRQLGSTRPLRTFLKTWHVPWVFGSGSFHCLQNVNRHVLLYIKPPFLPFSAIFASHPSAFSLRPRGALPHQRLVSAVIFCLRLGMGVPRGGRGSPGIPNPGHLVVYAQQQEPIHHAEPKRGGQTGSRASLGGGPPHRHRDQHGVDRSQHREVPVLDHLYVLGRDFLKDSHSPQRRKRHSNPPVAGDKEKLGRAGCDNICGASGSEAEGSRFRTVLGDGKWFGRNEIPVSSSRQTPTQEAHRPPVRAAHGLVDLGLCCC